MQYTPMSPGSCGAALAGASQVRGSVLRLATALVLAGTLGCSEAAVPPAGSLAAAPTRRLLPRVTPQPVEPQQVVLPSTAQEAWHIAAADLQRLDGVVAARLGYVRRQARLVQAPAVLRVPMHPGAVSARGWLSPAQVAGELPDGCEVTAVVDWGSAQVERDLSVPKAGSGVWQDWVLDRPTDAGSELRIALEPSASCGNAVLNLAVSEVLPDALHAAAAEENIVLVVIDTLRRDLMDCAEVSAELTPQLATRLCPRGAFFTDAYSTAPWTYPALASMLTGLRPRDHGGEGMDSEARDISPYTTTVAEILRWHGYHTGAVVSNWHATRGLWRGFDQFTEMMPRLGRGVSAARRAENVVDRAIGWIDGEAREPFFLWTLFIDLHEPVDAVRATGRDLPECKGIKPLPFRWKGLGRPAAPPSAAETTRMACRKALYREALRYIDLQIGRLVEHLDRRGLSGRTHLIVASDHGEEFWDHAEEQRASGEVSRRIWGIGHGHSLYAELAHVPLLVVPADGRAQGLRINALASVQDIFTTVLGFAGVGPPAMVRGQDLSRVHGADWKGGRRLVTQASTSYGPARRAVTLPGIRAIYTDPESLVLYDRSADPAEKAPLPADAPQAAEAMVELRRAFGEPMHYSPPSAADQDALRALGYVR